MKNIKTVLLLDFVITGSVALLQVAGAEILSPWLGISTFILRSTGIFLLLFISLIGYIIKAQKFNSALIKLIIGLNVLWAIDCLAFYFINQNQLTDLGIAFVFVQVISVIVFADLQYFSFKKVAA